MTNKQKTLKLRGMSFSICFFVLFFFLCMFFLALLELTLRTGWP